MPDTETPTANLSGHDARQFGLNMEDLFRLLWRRKLVLVAAVAACVVAALLYLHFATYRYTAVLQVVPAQTDSGRMPSGVAGLASLVGVSLPGSQAAASFGLYQESLTGRTVADVISRDQQLMKKIFPSRWDTNTNQWKLEKGPVGQAADSIKAVLGIPVYPPAAVNAEDLQRFIAANLRIKENERRSILTLEFRHAEPEIATTMLLRLHATADSLLRERVLLRSSSYINYIEKKLGVVTVAEHRLALAQMLSEQEQVQMVASSGLPFAASPFGETSVSARPTDPNPAFVLAISVVTGLFVGFLLIFLSSNIWRTQR